MDVSELAKEVQIADDAARPRAASTAIIDEAYWHNPNAPVAPAVNQSLYSSDQGEGGLFGRSELTDLTLPGNRRPLGSLHPVTADAARN